MTQCRGCGRSIGNQPHTCPPLRALWDRLWEKVDATGDCWEWTGARSWGYGKLSRGRRGDGHLFAHRAAWELLVGPVPEGYELDHLCRNHACVNPDHLEPVTHTENVRRGYATSARNARKTYCSRGHAYTPENTYVYHGARQCRACRSTARRMVAAQVEQLTWTGEAA